MVDQNTARENREYDRTDPEARDRESYERGVHEREPRDRVGWLAGSALRAGLLLVGIVLLLFAVGQAVGLNLLGQTARGLTLFVNELGQALSTQTGMWLVVAFLALLLILFALRARFVRY